MSRILKVQVPDEVADRIKNLAVATNRTQSFYLREAIFKHLEDIEDYYEAEQAYKEFKESGEKGIPLEQIRRELGLDD